MIKQYKIPLILFLLGMAITIMGALFKIMHWSFASGLLIVGMILEVVAFIWLVPDKRIEKNITKQEQS